MKDPKKVKRGRRARINGAKFERLVRKDLESKGWIVSKWQNNVEFEDQKQRCITCNQPREIMKGTIFDYGQKGKCLCHDPFPSFKGKCIPAKASRFRLQSTGFPDFIAYIRRDLNGLDSVDLQGFSDTILFIECKTNGYLSKIEKEKAKWYLDNNYCSKFLTASKHKEKGKIIIKYKEVKWEK